MAGDDKHISELGTDARTDPIVSHLGAVVSEVELVQGSYGKGKVHKASLGGVYTWVGTRADGVTRNYGMYAKAMKFAISDPNYKPLKAKQKDELRNVRKHVQERYERQTFLT